MHITLLPFANVSANDLQHIADALHYLDVTAAIGPPTQLPDSAYNDRRGQYKAHDLLVVAGEVNDERVIGVTDHDLYADNLNFVFGLANLPGKAAVVSLRRLRSGTNEQVYLDRAVKEVVHELGHTLGLQHCPNQFCVMHFSNSLLDTDLKNKRFCERCQRELPQDFQHPAPRG